MAFRMLTAALIAMATMVREGRGLLFLQVTAVGCSSPPPAATCFCSRQHEEHFVDEQKKLSDPVTTGINTRALSTDPSSSNRVMVNEMMMKGMRSKVSLRLHKVANNDSISQRSIHASVTEFCAAVIIISHQSQKVNVIGHFRFFFDEGRTEIGEQRTENGEWRMLAFRFFRKTSRLSGNLARVKQTNNDDDGRRTTDDGRRTTTPTTRR